MCKRLRNELLQSKLQFVSHVYLIRSKLSNSSAHVFGVSAATQWSMFGAASASDRAKPVGPTTPGGGQRPLSDRGRRGVASFPAPQTAAGGGWVRRHREGSISADWESHRLTLTWSGGTRRQRRNSAQSVGKWRSRAHYRGRCRKVGSGIIRLDDDYWLRLITAIFLKLTLL